MASHGYQPYEIEPARSVSPSCVLATGFVTSAHDRQKWPDCASRHRGDIESASKGLSLSGMSSRLPHGEGVTAS